MTKEFKLVQVEASGFGFLVPTPTPERIQRDIERCATDGWEVMQVLTLGLLIRRTFLVLSRDLKSEPNEAQYDQP